MTRPISTFTVGGYPPDEPHDMIRLIFRDKTAGKKFLDQIRNLERILESGALLTVFVEGEWSGWREK